MKYFNIKFLFISLFIFHGLKISANVFEGYTLFTNGNSQGATTYLINNNYEIINSWEHSSGVMGITYLFPDSTLLVPLQVENPFMTSLGPEGGWFQKLDWYGNVKWEYYYYTQNFQPHHDIEPLPNGNFLVIGWERKTEEETLNIGRIQTNGEFWPLKIVEIDPIGQDSGQVVWEWKIWDHLIQDADSTLSNFGPISDHPDLINVNLGNMPQNNHDWLHTNSIDYNEMYDQIVFSSRRLDEFFVIDHSTTTDQAAGDSGGISGKGGNILYRWGNPQNYGRGTENDRMLNAQHGVNWVPINYPGGNNILIFNNNPSGTSDGNSIVIELVPPMEENGQYFISPGSAFGPSEYYWSFGGDSSFFSNIQSGAFRLPNGNTIVTVTEENYLFEVDSDLQIVWEYFLDTDQNLTGVTARAKKYEPNYFHFHVGDINYNYEIELFDLLLMVEIINDNYIFLGNADLNQDGTIDEEDINLLIDQILQF